MVRLYNKNMHRTPDVVVLKRSDPRFSDRLRHIHDPPKLLYCRGNVQLLSRLAIAVVGTRKMTGYGGQATDAVVRQLVSAGFVVVSGLALGVDARAHKSTLEARGDTIAVLGSGIETITPTTNLRLGEEIIRQGGLIISEYPAVTRADKWTFPMRNRIISGLSLGVVVVEADRESGSLITAQCALDQGRDVFAVPGNIFAATSSGANHLIAQGARPVVSPTDIVEEYSERGFVNPPGARRQPALKDPVASAVFAILNAQGPQNVDALARETKFDVSKISATLSVLELQDIVASDGHGTWTVKK